MSTIRYFLLFLLLPITGTLIHAQSSQIRFEHLSTNEGLSHSNVLCVLQDSRGFMWFGTGDGLDKYDGYTFTVYRNDPQKSNSIANDYINNITESRDGDLWIATGAGLSHYDRRKEQFVNYQSDSTDNSLSSNEISNIIEDSKGYIWLATSKGLDMFDREKNTFTHYRNNPNDINSISDNFIRKVFEDRKGNLWIGTLREGLNLFDPVTKKFTRFLHTKEKNSIASNNISAIFEDHNGILWIGTDGEGIDMFNPEKKEFRHFRSNIHNKNSLIDNAIRAIEEDNKHRLWIGTENGGVSVYDPETGIFSGYQTDEIDNTSLSSSSINTIYKDHSGNIWVGTFNGGANILKKSAERFLHFKHIPFRNSLGNNKVLSMYEDRKNNIWIGTDGGGLDMFNPVTGNFMHYRHKKDNINSICGDNILSICEDSYGNIWIGTWANGITVLNPAKGIYKHLKNNPGNNSSLGNNNAWVIFEDSKKRIWVGTFGGGLNLFDPLTNSFTRYLPNESDTNSISSDCIYSIYEDRKGNIWIGSTGGLDIYNWKTNNFSRFRNDIMVNNMLEDKNGNLWITSTSGLYLLNRKNNSFVNYTMEDGLPGNMVFSILEDEKNNLWISTSQGISCFNPVKKTFKNFTVSDGLQSNEFKEKAFCKSHSGLMYFGGNNGFNQFDTKKIIADTEEPPMVITDFNIFNHHVPIEINKEQPSILKESITETKAITLSYKNSVFSFEFASLNYTNPDRKKYSYILEGFDRDWNEAGFKRTATYTNLEPGKYRFKVRSLDRDGNWSSQIARIDITITPPFWKTWWFRALASFLIIGLLVLAYLLRVKNIMKQKMNLETQVKERTEEINANMKELAALKEDLEKEKYYLDSLMDNMPDSIYFKDPDSKMIRVSKYMADRFAGKTDTLIGKTDFDFQDAQHAEKAFRDEKEILTTKKPMIDYLEKEVLADGNEHWVSTTKMPLINARGEVVGTFGMSRDVTNIKLLEQERHSALLDKAVAQGKFEIASDVMHDIGNAVVGFGAYLTRIKRLQEQDKAENLNQLSDYFTDQKESLLPILGVAKTDAIIRLLRGMAQTQKSHQEEINNSITEQINIITHIQEILHIQRQYVAGHQGQERKAVNLRNIINDSVSMLFASINKMSIAVSLDVDPNLPIIKGDRTKLMQVIVNILKNSIEAIDTHSPHKNVSVLATTDDGHLIIKIKDSGNGFDQQTAGQLFKRGFTTKSSGTGLGLYNCRSIIESHDGTIEITSEGEGKGSVTTIGFRIPA